LLGPIALIVLAAVRLAVAGGLFEPAAHIPTAAGFANASKQPPHVGPWLAEATVISSIGYSDDAPGMRYTRDWSIAKDCGPAPSGCKFVLSRALAGQSGESAPLLWQPGGWSATFPLRSYTCRELSGKWVYWKQHDTMFLVFADGGRMAVAHEREYSEAPLCGYGTDTVDWTARLDRSQVPPEFRPTRTPTSPSAAAPPAPVPLQTANLDVSLSPDASRAAPLAAAIPEPQVVYTACTHANIPSGSSDVRVEWSRFAAMLDQAGCSQAFDTAARRRVILGMMSAQACYQAGPVHTTETQDIYYCAQTLDQLIQMAAAAPIPEQLENLTLVDGRAYADALGNVRLVPHNKTWRITQT
jgi:hypothetical protein